MRKSLIIIILTIPLLLNGQNKFYDYHELDTSIIKLYADSLGKELYEFTKKFKLDYYQKSFVGIDSVPIKLHFILKADSTGQNATIEEIENEIAIVNNYFQNSNIHFFIFPDINYIYDDSLYDFEHDHDEDSLLTNYYFPFAINLYVVNTIYAVGHQVGGTGHGLGGTYDYVMMIYSAKGNGITLTHELGHVFHLAHTHGKYNFEDTDCPNEYWDDSIISDEIYCKGAVIYDHNPELDLNDDGVPDCQQTGDDICDTPAEPNLIDNSLLDGCTYIGTATDPNGILYNPTVGNIMSYGPCQDHLTIGQYAKMRFALENFGLHLLGHNCYPDDTLNVISADNSGVGSLRWAISVANKFNIPATINFNIPVDSTKIIFPETYLPLIRNKTIIDGATQPSGEIVIDGSKLTDSYWALYIYSDSVEIKNLTIKNFPISGITNYNGYDNITIENVKIDSCGSEGMNIQLCKNLNLINNEIMNCRNIGVYLENCSNLIISGNKIIGSGSNGLHLNKCNNVLIGDSIGNNYNIIHSNTYNGIALVDSTFNINILNNYIGTEPNDTTDFGNGSTGIIIENSFDIKIGSSSSPNFIINNKSTGIYVYNATYNLNILNNKILSNGGNGIQLNSCYQVSIGGNNPGLGNIISDNYYSGIYICDYANNIDILNNYVGTDDNNIQGIGNRYNGIQISDNSYDIRIGNNSSGNVFSENGYSGIVITEAAHNIEITGNSITNNYGNGFYIDSSFSIIIGGLMPDNNNVISGNTYNGININTKSNDIQILNNFLGVSSDGTTEMGNGHNGIYINNSFNINIGSITAKNIISNNNYGGIALVNASNSINISVNKIISNGHNGIYIDTSWVINIGGENENCKNIISGCGYSGISINNESNNIQITNNYIGTDTLGLDTIRNDYYGVAVNNSSNILIGDSSQGNIISGNKYDGIIIYNNSQNIQIAGNKIGTNVKGVENLHNNYSGIRIKDSENITIGGESEDEENIIGYNESSIIIDTSFNCLVKRNSSFCSIWEVYIREGSNNDIPAPSIDSIPDAFSIYGTSVENSEIYIYKSDTNCTSCEGRYYLGKANSINKHWKLNINDTLKNNEQITAMTAVLASSSPFSNCFLITGLPEIEPIDTSDILPDTTIEIITICEGENYKGFSATGVHYITDTNSTGNDSIIEIQLTVVPIDTTIEIESICEGEEYRGFSTMGIYYLTETASTGCDSIIEIQLSVTPVPQVFIGNDATIYTDDTIVLSSNTSFEEYLWNTDEITQSIQVIGEIIGSGTYHYWLWVKDENGCVNSDTIAITINEPVNINNIISGGYLKLYPNPINEFLNIEINGITEKIKLDIIAENGKIILSKNYTGGNIIYDRYNLKEFNAGWYIIKIQTGNEVKTTKFLLIK